MPGLELTLTDLRGDEPVTESFRHDGGITEFCTFLSHDEPVTDVLRLQGSDSFTETVPLLDDKGHMTPQDVERELSVDVAVRWGIGYETEMRSFVNVIATPKGGTHVAGFEAALTKTFNDVDARLAGAQGQRHRRDQGRRARGPDRRGDRPAGRAAVRGPDQGGARHAGRAVRRTQGGGGGAEELPDLDQARREGAGQAGHGEGRRARPRPGWPRASTARPSGARTRWSPRRCPAKLADCRSNDVDRSELFIVEGDSALGTAKLARDSEFQALLPIRGKILNVQKATVADVLKNAECASIIQVVGAGSGRTFDLEAGALRPDHLHGRRRLRRRAHPLPAGHAVLQVHARPGHRRVACSPPYRRCTGSS